MIKIVPASNARKHIVNGSKIITHPALLQATTTTTTRVNIREALKVCTEAFKNMYTNDITPNTTYYTLITDKIVEKAYKYSFTRTKASCSSRT